MGVIHAVTPSILIPFYVSPNKAATGIVLKTAPVLEYAKVVPTLPTANNDYNNNNLIQIPDFSRQLLYNYLHLTSVNSSEPPQTPTFEATPTVILPHSTQRNDWPQTIADSKIEANPYHQVTSKIKLLDSPFSASNVRPQKTVSQEKVNPNMATHFHLPLMPATTTTTTTTTNKSKTAKKMEQEKEFQFLPTWYPYTKQQFSNFFTIEDAITPYKPMEPLTVSYQPFFYDTRATPPAFTPVQLPQNNYFSTKSVEMNKFSLPGGQSTTELPFWQRQPQSTTTPTLWVTPTKSHSFFADLFDTFTTKSTIFTTIPASLTSTQESHFSNLADLFGYNFSGRVPSTTPVFTTTQRIILSPFSRKYQELYSSPQKAAQTLTKKSTSSFYDDLPKETLGPFEFTTPMSTIYQPTTSKPSTTKFTPPKLKLPKTYVKKNRSTSTSTTPLPVQKKNHKKHTHKFKHIRLLKKSTTNANNTLQKKAKNAVINNTTKPKRMLRIRSTLVPVLKLKKIPKMTFNRSKIEEQPTLITNTPTESITSQDITITPTTTTTTSSIVNRVTRGRNRGRTSYNNKNNNHTTGDILSSSRKPMNDETETPVRKRSRVVTRRRTSTSYTSSTSPMTATSTALSTNTTTINFANHKYPTSTRESAIMKIAKNNVSPDREKLNLWENLTSSTQASLGIGGLMSATEFPPLPIEVYFQKIRTSFN